MSQHTSITWMVLWAYTNWMSYTGCVPISPSRQATPPCGRISHPDRPGNRDCSTSIQAGLKFSSGSLSEPDGAAIGLPTTACQLLMAGYGVLDSAENATLLLAAAARFHSP